MKLPRRRGATLAVISAIAGTKRPDIMHIMNAEAAIARYRGTRGR